MECLYPKIRTDQQHEHAQIYTYQFVSHDQYNTLDEMDLISSLLQNDMEVGQHQKIEDMVTNTTHSEQQMNRGSFHDFNRIEYKTYSYTSVPNDPAYHKYDEMDLIHRLYFKTIYRLYFKTPWIYIYGSGAATEY
jgi:hypothetical protein